MDPGHTPPKKAAPKAALQGSFLVTLTGLFPLFGKPHTEMNTETVFEKFQKSATSE